MAEEWKIYRSELKKGLKSIFIALGISLLFYLTAIPNLKPGNHLRYILTSLTYGVVVFAWIWLFYAILWAIVTRYTIKQGRVLQVRWRIHLPLGLLGMVCGLISAQWLIDYTLDQEFSIGSMWESFLIGAFITLMFQFYYAYKHSSQENLVLAAAKTEAQLHVLKNQMQPHFLFNSLNSLAELIESNKDHAAVMTQNLSDLYREILENSKNQFSSLQSEISIIKKYLALEKLRFGERLSYKIEDNSNRENVFIPSLILQTLVENAIKHGIAPSTSGGAVQIKIYRDDLGFKGEVYNTGNSITPHSNRKGTGLENTRARLALLYGDNHQFRFESKPDGTTVSFWFSGVQSAK